MPMSPQQFDLQALIAAAGEAKQNAHCPYSKFRVGAALLTEGGSIYRGCNVENASYPVGICAEQTALVKAVSEGHKRFVAIAISSDNSTPCYPCGMCRQSLREFSENDLLVFCARNDGSHVSTTLKELLPHSFGPEDLKL